MPMGRSRSSNTIRAFTEPPHEAPTVGRQTVLIGLPFLKCKGKCQHACACAPTRPKDVAKLGPKPDEPYNDSPTTCAWLDKDGRCSTYKTRPPVCQLFGVVLAMRCPYGCRPRAWPSTSQERRWLRAARGGNEMPADTLYLIAEGAASAEKTQAAFETEEGTEVAVP